MNVPDIEFIEGGPEVYRERATAQARAETYSRLLDGQRCRILTMRDADTGFILGYLVLRPGMSTGANW